MLCHYAASCSWHRAVALSLQVLFDPHCSFLPSVSSANPGKRIKFVQSAVLDAYRDQFEPYAAFGCDMRSHYSGTLFRFPLRSPSLAERSRISKQVGELLRNSLATLAHVHRPSPAQLQVAATTCTAAATSGPCQPHSAPFSLLQCAQLLWLHAADSCCTFICMTEASPWPRSFAIV